MPYRIIPAMATDLRETQECPCYKLAGVLPSGTQVSLDHICERTGHDSVLNWSRAFNISSPYFTSEEPMGQSPQPWIVPVDDYRFANFGTGDTTEKIVWPVQITRIGETLPHAEIYVVLRQWVEEPDDNLPALFKERHPANVDFCVSEVRRIMDEMQEDWEAELEPYLDALKNSSDAAREDAIAYFWEQHHALQTPLREKVRREVLPYSGLPATPRTAQYFIYLATTGNTDELPVTFHPSRGAMVVSLGLIARGTPEVPRQELRGSMIQQVNFTAPWYKDTVVSSVLTVLQDHSRWWERQEVADYFGKDARSVKSGRRSNDPKFAADMEELRAEKIDEEEVVRRALERARNLIAPDQWNPTISIDERKRIKQRIRDHQKKWAD